MFPLLILGSAALLLAGCSSTPKEPEAPEQLPDLTPPEDPIPEEVHQSLKSEYGVSDNEINVGCHVIDYRKPGTSEKIVNYGGEILPCEISEYVLDRYDKYPDLARKLIGGPIPWSLDDGDPNTSFDEDIRKRVKAAFNRLDPQLRLSGQSPNSPAYQEKLAVALFYFVDFPSNPEDAAKRQKSLLERTKELENIGLSDFQEYLFKYGGLETSAMTQDSEIEASALEALSTQRGFCTEKSKILYAVYKMAGLSPFFVSAKGREFQRYLQSRGMELAFSNDSHQYIGISWPEKTRYFDLSFFNSDVRFPNPYRERLSQAQSWFQSNRGTELVDLGRTEDGIRALYSALQWHPSNYLAWSNLSVAYMSNNQDYKALAAGFRALELAPPDINPSYTIARTYWHMNRFDRALIWAEKATQVDGDDPDVFALKGFILADQNKFPEAEQQFQKALIARPKWALAHRGRGLLLLKQMKMNEAVEELQVALQLEPNNAEGLYLYGLSLHVSGRPLEAEPYIAQAMKADPNNEIYSKARRIFPQLNLP